MGVIDYYYGRKDGTNPNINFDITPLINRFDFYDYLIESTKEGYTSQSGFLIITENQYILGYNEGYGIGSHGNIFARAMKDIHGGGKINSFDEENKLDIECNRKYISRKQLKNYLL